jgi:hypothetical protein
MADAERDKNGRLLKGAALNPGGRKSHPRWFTDRGEDALAMMVAAATGAVVAGPETDPAVVAALTEMAADAKPGIRIEAARRMVEAVYGKARDVVTGPKEIKSITYVIVEAAGPRQPKEIDGVVIDRA